jgi:hypothetical protein
MIAAVVVGVIIILIGLNLFLNATYGIDIQFWPWIIVIIGILMVAGALYRWRKH